MGKKQSSCCTACLGAAFPCLFLFGAVFIALGLAFYLLYPAIITSQVDQKVTVEPGHATYEQLQNPTIKIYKKFYFFNWTNYESFALSGGKEKPVLEEKGPYSFIEKRTKTFLQSDDKDTLSYKQTKIFFFDPSTSGPGLSDSDMIYTINIPLIAGISKVKGSSIMLDALWGLVEATGTKLHIKQNATALAWGYSDSFIRDLHRIPNQLPVNVISIQNNNSAEDQKMSTIYTGVSNVSDVGHFVQWDGNRTLDIWFSPEANKIRGTEGFFFKPNLLETDNLTAFVDDAIRSFDLVYEGRVDHLGVETFRYGLDNRTFKSAFKYPKNAEYGSWCPDGMLFLGPTQVLKDTPVYGSKPHFLDADPLLLQSVEGLNPDREKHDTYIDVEPITGANIFFRRLMQVNVQINRTTNKEWRGLFNFDLNNVTGYNNSGVLYMPVLYISEGAEIDEEFKAYLEEKGLRAVRVLKIVAPVVFAVFLVVGVVLWFLGILACISCSRRIKTSSRNGELTPLLNEEKA